MAHLVHLDRLNRRRISVLWFLAHPIFGIDENMKNNQGVYLSVIVR